MNIIKTILFILLFPIIVFSQDKKLTIDIGGTASLYNIKSASGYNHYYKTNLGYRFGVDLSYCFKRSIISTGFNYSSQAYKVEYNYIVTQQGDPSIPRTGVISASYIEIPLTYSCIIINKQKLQLYLSSGIVYSMLVLSNDKTTFENNITRNSGYLNSSLLSIQIGPGIKYNFSDKLGIKLEPQYRIFSKGIDKIMFQHPSVIDTKVAIVFTLLKKNNKD